MTGIAPITGYIKNTRLKSAFIRHRALSGKGLSERLFGLMFSGLVYPQIWEDPAVDIEAMQIAPQHSIVTIGSGGCNMLAYLAEGPARIDVVDLNHHHVALNRLKLAAFETLPSYSDLRRMFAEPGNAANSDAFDRFIAPSLDLETLNYWNGRDKLGRRRISTFDRNIYRTGLLGRFIGAGHLAARLHGKTFDRLMAARTMEEQRAIFDREIAPLFDSALVRWITSRKSSLFGLGIPPQQYDELAGSSASGHVADVLRERLEKLACGFPLKDNYFAWQAFSRRYPAMHEGSLPLYLHPDNFSKIRANAHRVEVHHKSVTELLKQKRAGSVDRFVLLDAQDWMTAAQLNDLWNEINRAAAPGARVIFRTAAVASPLEAKLDPRTLEVWDYLPDLSNELLARDRSAIYGGFHVYRKAS
ncbi:S-adenosylmethionine-diacylglycerol 3-amino-3-carboxypropyl transferase [Ensifer adhaerens]|nr:S-adenosylmethionine-diacylglycerol 3-amino-3-carboxypropyl transferase [Ensifer adhaerens]